MLQSMLQVLLGAGAAGRGHRPVTLHTLLLVRIPIRLLVALRTHSWAYH